MIWYSWRCISKVKINQNNLNRRIKLSLYSDDLYNQYIINDVVNKKYTPELINKVNYDVAMKI